MTPALVALVGLLIICSGLLSGSETGLYAVSRPRLRLRAAAGDARAQRLESLLSSPAGVLGALLIGNNALNFALTAAVTGAIAEAGWSHAVWWTTALLSPFLLVFAEMAPKNIFRQRADSWMPYVASPLSWLRSLLVPLVVPLLLLERLTAGRSTEVVLSRERLRTLMFEGVEEGLLTAAQHELAHGVMRFAALPVGLIGVPWASTKTVPAGTDREGCIAIAREHGLSRLPVVDPASGAVEGLLNVHDLIFQPEAPVADLVTPLPSFSADTPADEALRRMGAERRHIALIGTPESPAGVVALDDLVVELVGGVGPPRRKAGRGEKAA